MGFELASMEMRDASGARCAGGIHRFLPRPFRRREGNGGTEDDRARIVLRPWVLLHSSGGGEAQLFTKSSSARLTSSAWVHSIPCGAPSISTYVASGRSSRKR